MTTDHPLSIQAATKPRWDDALNVDPTWVMLGIVLFIVLIG